MQEYQFRYIQFAKTYAEILAFNQTPGQTSTVGFNKFTDWTEEERKLISNYVPLATKNDANVLTLATNDLPAEINWVEKGAVNPV